MWKVRRRGKATISRVSWVCPGSKFMSTHTIVLDRQIQRTKNRTDCCAQSSPLIPQSTKMCGRSYAQVVERRWWATKRCFNSRVAHHCFDGSSVLPSPHS